jgi:predicted aspartyl protease
LRFELADKAPVIIVDANANGKGPFKFLVDTGSSATVITEEISDALGFHSKSPTTGKPSVGCCTSTVVKLRSMQIGETEAKDVSVVLGNLSAISRDIGTRIDGIIGSTFMTDYKVVIDYPKQEILFGNNHQGEEAKGEVFRFAGRVPFIIVEAMVNDKGPFSFLIDTGATITTITEQTADALGLHRKASGQRRALSGSFAGVTMDLVIADSIQVDAAEARDINVGVHNLTPLSHGIGTPIDGIIGYNFMKDYRVIIDYLRLQITFKGSSGSH